MLASFRRRSSTVSFRFSRRRDRSTSILYASMTGSGGRRASLAIDLTLAPEMPACLPGSVIADSRLGLGVPQTEPRATASAHDANQPLGLLARVRFLLPLRRRDFRRGLGSLVGGKSLAGALQWHRVMVNAHRLTEARSRRFIARLPKSSCRNRKLWNARVNGSGPGSNPGDVDLYYARA